MSCAIELEIGAGSSPGKFVTRVVEAPSGGEPSAVVQLDVEGLLGQRETLEATVLASAVAGRRIVPGHEQQLRRVGQQLFEALFSGAVLGTYRASLGIAQERGEPLRVVLRLTAPQLAALPWEALFDPETEAYLCRKEPLVRHVPSPYTRDPLEITPPLRVLGLVASPRGLDDLNVTAEQEHLSQALATLRAAGLIELEWLPQATWEGVQEKLLSAPWHVVHFIGHGDYDLSTDQGVLALVGEDGGANLVEAQQLADLLNEARPTPRLVVLNSCSSGQEGTRDLFSGTAAALVRSGISAVAAMQFTVSDPAAIAFSRGFYTAIAHGRSVDDAVGSGRISILGRPHTLEWVTPVLYVRGENKELFHVVEPRHGAAPTQVPPAEERDESTRLDLGVSLRAPFPAFADTAVQVLRLAVLLSGDLAYTRAIDTAFQSELATLLPADVSFHCWRAVGPAGPISPTSPSRSWKEHIATLRKQSALSGHGDFHYYVGIGTQASIAFQRAGAGAPGGPPLLFLGVTDPVAAELVDSLQGRSDARQIAGVAYGGGPEDIAALANRLFPGRSLVFFYQTGIPQDEAIAARFRQLRLYKEKVLTIAATRGRPDVNDLRDQNAVYFSWYTFDRMLEDGSAEAIVRDERFIVLTTTESNVRAGLAVASIAADDDEIGRAGAEILADHAVGGAAFGDRDVVLPQYRFSLNLDAAARRGVEFSQEVQDAAAGVYYHGG